MRDIEEIALMLSQKDAEIARLRRDIAQANAMCKSDELQRENVKRWQHGYDVGFEQGVAAGRILGPKP
jgi:hypothetical protein